MSTPNPAIDLATALAAGGAIALLTPPGGSVVATYPGLILSGPERESDAFVKNQIINVVNTGGPPPEPVMNGGGNIVRGRAQVMVRSAVDNFSDGEALARAARRKLHLVVLAGYIDVMAQEGEPTYLGVDERQLHRWSFNLLARWQE